MAGNGANGWSWDGGGGGCVDMEPYSEPWLMAEALSLGVTTEEAMCVITEGDPASSSTEVLSKGEGTMGCSEAMP